MKKLLFLITIGFASFHLNAQDLNQNDSASANKLEGNWVIDLRPKADADEYLKDFSVVLIKDNQFKGEFYESEISNGRINRNWSKLYFAFTTEDGSHKYYHSGYLENGIMKGITHCPTRDFVMPWSGKRN